MEYRYEAATLEGFIQQLAVAYIAHGYFFYVTGHVPDGKDPAKVDQKLLDKYGIRLSKFARHRRKTLGQASLQYIRFERFFVLIATHGNHLFFQPESEGGEGSRIRDVRRAPIRYAGYSLSRRRRTGDGSKCVAHVRIDQPTYLEMRDTLVDLATKRSRDWLEYQFRTFPFEPYAPIRRQMLSMFGRVNKVRQAASQELLDASCLRLRRRALRPFDGAAVCSSAAGVRGTQSPALPSPSHISTVVGEATTGRSTGKEL